MRPERAALLLGAALVLLLGLRPDALPFMPQAQFSDAALAHWPAARHLRAAVLTAGVFPLWQDTIMAGQPFAANPLNKTAYPLQWLALLLEPAPHLNLLIALHLLLAGWGMWRWARALGLRPAAAALAGLTYALAPRALAHLGAGHLDLIYALAWWPWLMQAAGRLAQPGKALRLTVQMGLFAGLLLLADVRLGLFALALAGAYALWNAAAAGRGRAALRLLPAAALCLAVTLAVTLPLAGWGPYLSRGDLDRAEAGLFSLEVGQLVGLALPPRGGTPETFTYLGLGTLALALAGIAAVPRRARVFWLAALLAAALYALGVNGPLWPFLVDALPPLRWFRVPGRAWLVVVLCACLLAGFGAQSALRLVERLRAGGGMGRLRTLRLLAAGFGGAALLCGAVLTAAGLDPLVGLSAAAVGGLLGGALLLALYGRLTPGQLTGALLLIAALDSGLVGTGWLEWRGPDAWLHHQADAAAALAGADRVYSPNYALEQQVAAAYGLRLFGGVDPFQLRGLVDAIGRAGGVAGAGYSVVQPPLDALSGDGALDTANCAAVPDTELLAAWGVSHIVSRCPLSLAGGAPQIVNGIYIYSNPAYSGPADLSAAGWLPGWPGLPDLARVEDLNRLTVAAALLAGAALLACLLLLAWRLAHDT